MGCQVNYCDTKRKIFYTIHIKIAHQEQSKNRFAFSCTATYTVKTHFIRASTCSVYYMLAESPHVLFNLHCICITPGSFSLCDLLEIKFFVPVKVASVRFWHPYLFPTNRFTMHAFVFLGDWLRPDYFLAVRPGYETLIFVWLAVKNIYYYEVPAAQSVKL